MDPADQLHTFDDPAEGGKALAVRVSVATEVERWLIADADEEVVLRCIGTVSRHGNCALDMFQAGVAGTFQWDWRKKLVCPCWIG
jgi:hypothetical protein